MHFFNVAPTCQAKMRIGGMNQEPSLNTGKSEVFLRLPWSLLRYTKEIPCRILSIFHSPLSKPPLHSEPRQPGKGARLSPRRDRRGKLVTLRRVSGSLLRRASRCSTAPAWRVRRSAWRGRRRLQCSNSHFNPININAPRNKKDSG